MQFNIRLDALLSATGLALGLFSASVSISHAAPIVVYATYAGSQQGVTVRNQGLVQTNVFGTGVTASGIALGVNNDLYISAANQIRNYNVNGSLINTMTFPDPAINYTDVDVGDGRVVASYSGSQQGVTIRDYGLNQSFSFNTGFNISGIAAGANAHVYLSSGNHLYDYLIDGTLVTDMTFPDTGINYTDVAYSNGMVFASYSGSQRGVTTRNLALGQTSFFSVAFEIDSIAIGGNNDIFLASGNHLYNYSLTGSEITHMEFPDAGILYTGIAVAAATAVPEPGSIALVLAGLALIGGVAHRRKVQKT